MTSLQITSEADPRRWKALAVLALVQFMLILDVTVVNVALPNIQKDLDFGPTGLAWVVDGYVLTAGGLLLLGGRLSDLVGRKRLFLIGVAIFGAASITCGLAQNPAMLVTSRFVQGSGEALAAPAALGLVALLFPDPGERTKALGIWGGIAGLGGTLGTVISGLLVNIGPGSWRWIFLINIPVAAFALAVVPRLVDESRARRAVVDPTAARARPDVAGALTATLGLVAIVYGILRGGQTSWGSGLVVGSLIAGVALLTAFVLIERTTRDPLVPLSFFSNRTRVATNGVTIFFSSGFFAYFYLQTLYLQQVLGWSPLRTGVSYLPFGVSISVAIGLGTGLMPKVGTKRLLLVGFALCSVALGLLSRLTIHSGYAADVLPSMILLAVGAGLCFPAITNASLHGVSGENASLASGVQNAVQQIGGALGIAVFTTIAVSYVHGVSFSDPTYPVKVTDGYTSGFAWAAIVMAIGVVVIAFAVEKVVRAPQQQDADVTGVPTAAAPV
ncbi:MAG TPA: MFS transporter [Frankiaceae bacterium]|jgi:EmrB/QacA subfamily drug resistance transporter|nr:MFS transporter [Frankiaceae bacterium]